MKVPLISYHLTFFLLLFHFGIRADGEDEKKVYIVYMGAANGGREDYVQLLASVLKREAKDAEKTLIHSYRHGFSGFAARLSKKAAAAIAGKSGVVSVFVDPVLQLHTTRSWDFLQDQTDLETNPNNTSSNPTSPGSSASGTDTIIGLLDTGVWPESESFNDKGMGAIPNRWKGICMEGSNFTASNCNKKLIGARYYNVSSSESKEEPDLTPRDSIGHGTHTASTAGGSAVGDASYYGLAKGTAKGGSPSSRIAMYKVCTSEGCRGSTILAGYDDAIGDGVDVISVSLGASSFSRPDFSTDPMAIGAFHAVEKGITVVCSAGNDGPEAGTVVNAAPWIFTVGATTIDRHFESDVVLGGNKLLKGEDINFSNLGKSPVHPLIYGGSAKSNSSTDSDASNGDVDALHGKKIKGKIVVYQHPRDSIYSKRVKMKEVKRKRGIGLILIEADLGKAVASRFGGFPVTTISSDEGGEILSYINSTRNPVATILPTVSVIKYKPAPTVTYFSSRGPSTQTRNILKPDIAAPGENILAAWKSTYDASEIPPGQSPSPFYLLSGTSMSCPHVSGVAATIKARNPTWSPSSIRSAIMTTASQTNNEKAPLTDDTGSTATPYDYGAGEVSPSGALEPGLVYETEKLDYLIFLCNYGYNTATIKQISTLPDGFECPKDSGGDLISNLNYPSIAISKFEGKESKKVSRTVTNVGADDETVYTATIKSPDGLDVKVIPDRLQFTKNSKKLSYQVVFSSSSSVKGDLFGSITWTDGKHRVRTPFAVTSDVS